MEALDDDPLGFHQDLLNDVVDADPARHQAVTGVGDSTITSNTRKRKSREDEEPNGLGIYMIISGEERQWALTLKRALSENEETKSISLSDMEIVQFGMVERGHLLKSLDRIKKLDQFRTQYGIKETVEDGVECVKKFMKQQPGLLLNLDQCARHKHYVQVMDMANFHPRRVQFDKDWRVFLSGMHYLMVCLNPSLSAVRNGLVGIAECDGMGWHNFCMDFERRLWHEHPTVYPARWHEISWVNTPTPANMLFALLKPMMPEEIRSVFQLGVKFDESFDGRLNELFLQPSVEEANQRVIWNVQSFLAKRYHNQEHFQL